MEIIIGDEHGRGKFCNIYNKLKDDSTIKHFVCVGDYFDPYFSYKEDASDLLENYNKIIEAARKDPRIILLLGNHDIHYLMACDRSRFDYFNAEAIKKAFMDNIDLFKLAYKFDNGAVVSHAGITKTWLETMGLKTVDDINGLLKKFIETQITNGSISALRYNDSDNSGYGESCSQGCTWVRPNGLIKDSAFEYQIVGHTQTENISYFLFFETSSKEPIVVENENGKFAFVDTGDNFNYYSMES